MSATPLRFLPRQAVRSIPTPAGPSRSFHSSLLRSRPTSTNGHGHHAHPPRSSSSGKKPSAHLVWYREIVPAMIPIFLISTTVFLSLSLLRTHLSHSKSLAESSERIAELEGQLAKLRLKQQRAREREKKERERILPLVVERVLQRVGVVGGDVLEVEEEKVEKVKEEPRLL